MLSRLREFIRSLRAASVLTDVEAERERRGKVIKKFIGANTVVTPYYDGRLTVEALKKAWESGTGDYEIIRVQFTREVPDLPSFFGAGKYAVIIGTQKAGRFYGTCDSIKNAHQALADALVPWITEWRALKK